MLKDVLAVGDSTELEIIFSSKKYRTKITKRPKIQTNEGPPDKFVSITVNVVTRPDSTYPLIMRPYKIDLSQTGSKTIDNMSFEIRNVSDEDLKIKMISYASEYFEVDLPKKIKAGETAKAKVKLRKKVLKKSFEKSFTIELNDEVRSRFTIPVKRKLAASAITASKKPGK